jgi:hypothetical protein
MIEKVQDLVTHSSPAIIGLVVFLLTQAAFGIIWITRQETRITALEGQTKVQQIVVDRLTTVEHEFDIRVTREATIIRGNVENLRSDLGRVQEQQQRIIQLLDSMNNTMQEHLRGHPR